MVADMTASDPTLATIERLISPFNTKQTVVTVSTTFLGDLEWDSLTIMDFVATVEDEFDIMITMNMQAEIETVGQLVTAIDGLKT